jgi:hypothetical protein
MRFIIFLSIFLSIFPASAAGNELEVDILTVELGLADHQRQPTLCLTVIRLPDSGELLGIVEDIWDCYYARSAKKSRDGRLMLKTTGLLPLSHPELRAHLQRLDGQLQFYFSEGE